MYGEDVETIYNLIPKPPPVVERQPLHVSSFKEAAERSMNSVKKYPHRSMGEPKERLYKDPSEYLKKRSRRDDLPPRPRTRPHGNETLMKPPVPTQKEIPKTPSKQRRNFILENWKQAPLTKKLHPEKPVRWYTDKPDYGMTPEYIEKVKQEYRNEGQYWDDIRDSMEPEDTEVRCRLLTEEEKQKILDGLNANLAENKKRYAALSFGQDHLSFRRRKERMENEAAQLEADIKTFSRQNVYITEV